MKDDDLITVSVKDLKAYDAAVRARCETYVAAERTAMELDMAKAAYEKAKQAESDAISAEVDARNVLYGRDKT